jgi:hypothetical protein
VSSWVDATLTTCYQVMETSDAALIDQWIANCADLVEYEVVPVITSKDAVAKLAGAEPPRTPAALFGGATPIFRASWWVLLSRQIAPAHRRTCWRTSSGISGSGSSCRRGSTLVADQSTAERRKDARLETFQRNVVGGTPPDGCRPAQRSSHGAIAATENVDRSAGSLAYHAATMMVKSEMSA